MQKRMLCLAISTVFSIGTALAVPQDQGPPPPPDQMAPQQGRQQAPNGDRIMQAMTKRLNLTEDQQNQIRPIMQDEMTQIMGLRNDSSLAPRDRMQKMRAIRDDSNAKVRAVLTPDQRPQFDAMQQEQQDRMRQRRQQGGPNGNPNGPPPPPDGSNQ